MTAGDTWEAPTPLHVVIVGGGLAGLACARKLLGDDRVRVTLIDSGRDHEFKPLLYQVATAQLAAGDVAVPLATLLARRPGCELLSAEVAGVDAAGRAVITADGRSVAGDVLVLAAGARAAYFGTPGAAEHAFPLYTLADALRLKAHVVSLFSDAARDPVTLQDGALDFVVVGGGTTGVEIAGGLAEMFSGPLRSTFPAVDPGMPRLVLVTHGDRLLRGFSERAHRYAVEVLEGQGITIRFGLGVTEVGPGHVALSDGTRTATRCVVWAAGVRGAPLTEGSGLPLGHAGRVRVLPDLTVSGFPGVVAVGDVASIPGHDGDPLPQLGSVAQQSGEWAAANILRSLDGHAPTAFRYHDRGVMAMIGWGAAVAEVGPRRRQLRGRPAFAAWLGLHAMLMSGAHNRADAFVAWARDAVSHRTRRHLLGGSESEMLDWSATAGEVPEDGDVLR